MLQDCGFDEKPGSKHLTVFSPETVKRTLNIMGK